MNGHTISPPAGFYGVATLAGNHDIRIHNGLIDGNQVAGVGGSGIGGGACMLGGSASGVACGAPASGIGATAGCSCVPAAPF